MGRTMTDEEFWAEVVRRVRPGTSGQSCETCRQLAEQHRAWLDVEKAPSHPQGETEGQS